MSSYKSQNLFSSGPHTFRDHGFVLRHALLEAVGIDGARVVPEGKTARTITQAGALYADNPDQLHERIGAVEQAMDGLGGELIDNLERALPRMVMTEMRWSRVRRAGALYSVGYTLLYVQTLPDPVSMPVPIPPPLPEGGLL